MIIILPCITWVELYTQEEQATKKQAMHIKQDMIFHSDLPNVTMENYENK